MAVSILALPWPERRKPRLAPAVAAPTPGLVLVELTRPRPDAFRVRVRSESVEGLEDVAELHVFYGARVEDVSETLRRGWAESGMRPTGQVAGPELRVFDFAAGFTVVATAVEAEAWRYRP